MGKIPFDGACYSDPLAFLRHLESIHFNLWRPRFITMHHTGSPDTARWNEWQTRPKPVTDEQWMINLASYYGSGPPDGPADGPWSSGPHFFVTPKHICVLSPPHKRGVHARSFNAISWGVEVVGDFDRDSFAGPIKDMTVRALAAMHIAAGLQPGPFVKMSKGLHFHRDDPLTSKTCPGRKVDKAELIELVEDQIADMTRGDSDEDPVQPVEVVRQHGIAKVPATDTLNVRADASAKAPIVVKLRAGEAMDIVGTAMNGPTKWLEVEARALKGWVAAQFVQVT